MSSVEIIEVAAIDEGIRLDRWFKSRFPDITFGQLQKLMRTGQVRVDGGRVKPGTRLLSGQKVRIPPLRESVNERYAPPARGPIDPVRAREIESCVLHCDDDVIVINKPSGLAVQGGTGTTHHVDGMLDVLQFGANERPKLVHRLDKDTSGVLVLARNSRSARHLATCFRSKDVRKLYWALAVGVPIPPDGQIELRLLKAVGRGGERMVVDPENGKFSRSRYKVLDQGGRRASLVALEPLTGRTHQLRVHLADALGTPIAGDGKYGGRDAYLEGGGVEKKLHLHARRIQLPLADGRTVDVSAPLPKHMLSSLEYLGFRLEAEYDQFLELE